MWFKWRIFYQVEANFDLCDGVDGSTGEMSERINRFAPPIGTFLHLQRYKKPSRTQTKKYPVKAIGNLKLSTYISIEPFCNIRRNPAQRYILGTLRNRLKSLRSFLAFIGHERVKRCVLVVLESWQSLGQYFFSEGDGINLYFCEKNCESEGSSAR